MLNQIDVYAHDTLGVCFWLLPSLIVGAIMVVMSITHSYRHRRREKNFTEEMEELYSLATIEEKERMG